MENKNIIIILVAVVIVLAVIAGAMFMQQSHAKEPTKLKITSESKQTEGGKLKIQLTDTNKTALSKEIVNITVTDKKGRVNTQSMSHMEEMITTPQAMQHRN